MTTEDPQESATKPATWKLGGFEVEIDFLKVLARAMHGYKIILACALTCGILSALFALALPKTYTARAMFSPPHKEASAVGALSLFGDDSDLYLGLLGSRTVADNVIDHLHLIETYRTKNRTMARSALASQSSFSVSKNTLITVDVTTTDPVLSAKIGNAYLDALYELNGQMNNSSSSRRRQFFEEQLNAEKNDLTAAEEGVESIQERNGLVSPEGEAQAGLSEVARLQSRIRDAQTSLSALLTHFTEQNAEVIQLRAQISALNGQLRQQQRGAASSNSGITSSAKLPKVMLDYLRKARDLKQRETVYDTLTREYERARLSALDPGPQLQIVDRAAVPEQKSGPPRTRIALAGLLVGTAIGLLYVFFAESFRSLTRRYRQTSHGLRSRMP